MLNESEEEEIMKKMKRSSFPKVAEIFWGEKEGIFVFYVIIGEYDKWALIGGFGLEFKFI